MQRTRAIQDKLLLLLTLKVYGLYPMHKCICGFQAACCSTLAANYCSIHTARSSSSHPRKLGSQLCAYSLSKTATYCNTGEGFSLPLEFPGKQAKRKTADKISCRPFYLHSLFVLLSFVQPQSSFTEVLLFAPSATACHSLLLYPK